MLNPPSLKLIFFFHLWKYIHRDNVITETFYFHNLHLVLNIQNKKYIKAFPLLRGHLLGKERLKIS